LAICVDVVYLCSRFFFAYVALPTATGALLLFGAVQATMISYGVWVGKRLQGLRLVGLMLAFGGLMGLLLPGLSAPPLHESVLMLCAGVAWGVYSLRGKGNAKAATVQLSVPVIAALGGIVFLDEAISLRLALACVTILGGIALVILGKKDSGTV
jgi:drug/metabolite transporter (DMT)-like permease